MVCKYCDCYETSDLITHCTTPSGTRTFTSDSGEADACSKCRDFLNPPSPHVYKPITTRTTYQNQPDRPRTLAEQLHATASSDGSNDVGVSGSGNGTASLLNPLHGSTAHNRPHNKRGGIDTSSSSSSSSTDTTTNKRGGSNNDKSSTIFGLDRNTALLIGGGGLVLILILVALA